MEQESVVIVWREVLTGLFSVLSRMACLANCYDLQTCRYFHGKVAEQLGSDEADQALRRVHELVWVDWLRGSLDQQQADLQWHLSGQPQGMARTVAHWKAQRPFLSLVPASAKPAERILFITNLEAALEFLQNRYGAEPENFLTSKIANPDVHHFLIKVIRQRYRDANLSLKTLSADVHLSERHLGRLFKGFTGKSFRQYLCDLRMAEAAALLATTKESVKVIAGTVGYSCCSHFDEDFRSVMGCTPIDFRAKSNKG